MLNVGDMMGKLWEMVRGSSDVGFGQGYFDR